jgi:hypothetical protein
MRHVQRESKRIQSICNPEEKEEKKKKSPCEEDADVYVECNDKHIH